MIDLQAQLLGYLRETLWPRRGSAEELGRRVAAYLERGELAEGAKLFTDGELVEGLGLSRSTIRRALGQLEASGWVRREVGRGTYAGPRAGAAALRREQGEAGGAQRGGAGRRGVTRVCVMAFRLGEPSADWYTAGIVRGLESRAHELGLAIELLGIGGGGGAGSVEALAGRLLASRPDLLACLYVSPQAFEVLHEARKAALRAVVTGLPQLDPGLPCLAEDNHQAMDLCVGHLHEHGHERIGLVLNRFPGPWLFERHEGFGRAMTGRGLAYDESLVCWVDNGSDAAPAPGALAALEAFVGKQRPTALVCGSYAAACAAGVLMQRGRLAVPGAVSVVAVDQLPTLPAWFGGLSPTVLELPLADIGRRIGALAVGEGQDADVNQPRPIERFACRLVSGDTVHARR